MSGSRDSSIAGSPRSHETENSLSDVEHLNGTIIEEEEDAHEKCRETTQPQHAQAPTRGSIKEGSHTRGQTAHVMASGQDQEAAQRPEGDNESHEKEERTSRENMKVSPVEGTKGRAEALKELAEQQRDHRFASIKLKQVQRSVELACAEVEEGRQKRDELQRQVACIEATADLITVQHTMSRTHVPSTCRRCHSLFALALSRMASDHDVHCQDGILNLEGAVEMLGAGLSSAERESKPKAREAWIKVLQEQVGHWTVLAAARPSQVRSQIPAQASADAGCAGEARTPSSCSVCTDDTARRIQDLKEQFETQVQQNASLEARHSKMQQDLELAHKVCCVFVHPYRERARACLCSLNPCSFQRRRSWKLVLIIKSHGKNALKW